MKKILVLGGGFAGVAALLELSKRTRGIELTLIDRRKFHLFTPSLYEVATSEEPQKNIAIPFSEIFSSKVKIIQGVVKQINTKISQITLEDGSSFDYDYLLISLGSQSAYFGIKGLREYSLDLKTLLEAVRIKNQIKEVFNKNISEDKVTKVVVGGGGFSGTELCAELVTYRDRLLNQKGKKESTFEISILEGSDRLLSNLDPNVSTLAKRRLEKMGVKIFFNCFIEEVFPNYLKTKSKEKISFDILIWTGGVTSSQVLAESGFEVNKKGQVEVDEFLKVKGFKNIFAAGDLAGFKDKKTGKSAPGVAQVAEEEGRTAGVNIVAEINNEKLKPYNLRHFGYIVPLKGKFVTAELGWIKMEGILAWFLQQLVFLRYLLGILALEKAFQRWNEFELNLEQD